MRLKQSKLAVIAVAAFAGYANLRLVELFWAFWQPVNPIAHAVFGQRPVSPHYGWLLYPTDALASVLVSLPLGIFIAWLGARHFRWAALFATLPYLTSVYSPGLLQVITSARAQAVAIALTAIAVVPLACWLGRLLVNRYTPNNSSKPTPLRGAA